MEAVLTHNPATTDALVALLKAQIETLSDRNRRLEDENKQVRETALARIDQLEKVHLDLVAELTRAGAIPDSSDPSTTPPKNSLLEKARDKRRTASSSSSSLLEEDAYFNYSGDFGEEGAAVHSPAVSGPRRFFCDVEGCSRSYGSRGALNTHKQENHSSPTISYANGQSIVIPRRPDGTLHCPCGTYKTPSTMTFRSHARQCAGDPNQPSNGLTNGEDAATTAKAEDTAEKLENGVDAGPERSGVAATLPPIPSHTSSPRLPTTYSVDGPRKPGRPPKSMGQQQQTINLAPIPEPNGPMNPSPTFHDGTENTERYFAWYDIICRYCPPNFEVTSGVHNRVSQFRTAHNLTPKPIARQYTTGKATFGVPEKLIPEFIRHALKLGVPKRERMTEAEKLAVAKDTFAAADRKAPAASGALLREAPAPFVLPEPRFVIEANAEFCDGSANTEGYVAWTDLFACYAPAPAEITHTVKKRFSQFRLAHPELSCKTVAKKHSEGYSTTGIPAAMVTDFLAEMLRPFKTRGEPVPKRAKMEKDGEGGIDLAVVGEGGAATLESHGNSSAAENGNGNGAVEETESEQEQDEMDLETSLLDELGDFSSLDDAELPQFVQGALYNVLLRQMINGYDQQPIHVRRSIKKGVIQYLEAAVRELKKEMTDYTVVNGDLKTYLIPMECRLDFGRWIKDQLGRLLPDLDVKDLVV